MHEPRINKRYLRRKGLNGTNFDLFIFNHDTLKTVVTILLWEDKLRMPVQSISLSCQANWELVVMLFHDKLVDDGCTIFIGRIPITINYNNHSSTEIALRGHR